jgi:O-antigen/teichoic acid export membrane protein
VTRAILPKFSALVGAGDLEQARLLLAKGYPAVALVLMPAMGLVFVAAKELVEIIYTRNYVEAAPIMQIYLVGQMAGTFEAGYLLIAIKRGKLAASIHGVCLILSVILCLIGIKMFGLNGAAAGSVICVFIAELWALFAVAHALKARPVDIVRFSITARIVLVTVLAVVATLFVRHALEFKIDLGWMLAVESLAYFLCLAVFMWIFGLYQHGLNTVTTFFKR